MIGINPRPEGCWANSLPMSYTYSLTLDIVERNFPKLSLISKLENPGRNIIWSIPLSLKGCYWLLRMTGSMKHGRICMKSEERHWKEALGSGLDNWAPDKSAHLIYELRDFQQAAQLLWALSTKRGQSLFYQVVVLKWDTTKNKVNFDTNNFNQSQKGGKTDQ
jgi:hypothetical protein